MKTLRILAIIVAMIVIAGELFRSFGADRPIAFVLDDVLIGCYLIISAIAFTKDTQRRRAFFASGWGMGVSLAYISFFSKVYSPEKTNAGNFDISTLTILVGIAFAVAIAGLVAAIFLPYRSQSE